MSIKILSRHSQPSKLDTADQFTLCKINSNNFVDSDFYIQLSLDSEIPNWEYLGKPSQDMLVKLVDLLR